MDSPNSPSPADTGPGSTSTSASKSFSIFPQSSFPSLDPSDPPSPPTSPNQVKRRPSFVLNFSAIHAKPDPLLELQEPVSGEISHSGFDSSGLAGDRPEMADRASPSSSSKKSPLSHSGRRQDLAMTKSSPTPRRASTLDHKTAASLSVSEGRPVPSGGDLIGAPLTPTKPHARRSSSMILFNTAAIKSTAPMLKFLADPVCCASFQAFLKSQVCEETLLFYLAVERYRSGPEDGLAEACMALFMEFISHAGDHVVNVTSEAVQAIKDKVHDKNYTRDMFDDAQKEVIRLMAENSWLEFRGSKFYNSPRIAESTSADTSSDGNATPKSDESRSSRFAQSSGSAPSTPMQDPTILVIDNRTDSARRMSSTNDSVKMSPKGKERGKSWIMEKLSIRKAARDEKDAEAPPSPKPIPTGKEYRESPRWKKDSDQGDKKKK